MSNVLDDVVAESIKKVEVARLESENLDFYYLMNEYRDGILLFDITNTNVWTKASTDSAGLVNFYNDRVDMYRWDKRVYATIYTTATESIANEAHKLITSRRGARLSHDDFIARFAKDSSDQLASNEFAGNPSEPSVMGYQEWQGGISEVREANGKFQFVRIDKVTEDEIIPLDSIRGQVIADYQDYLEKEWIEYLRSKYPVNVNQDVLAEIKVNLK